MSTIRRAVIAGALAVPLTLGAAGIASADTYSSHATYVGPHGAASHTVAANSDRNGAGYHESTRAAGPRGVYFDYTDAWVDDHGNGGYAHGRGVVGPHGVATTGEGGTIGDDNDGRYHHGDHNVRYHHDDSGYSHDTGYSHGDDD